MELAVIKEAIAPGYWNCDRNLIASICDEVFHVTTCRECSSDLISCFNKLCKFVREQEILLTYQKLESINMAAKKLYRLKDEWKGTTVNVTPLRMVINEETLNQPEVIKFVLGHSELSKRVELVEEPKKGK